MPLNVAVVTEGYGDVSSAPTLIAKAANLIGIEAYASHPIRAGEWKKLCREGALEKFAELALSRDPDLILFLLDMDDQCVAEQAAMFEQRIAALNLPVPVKICFVPREYEAWFLTCADEIAAFTGSPFDVTRACGIRGAKEQVSQLLGTRYRETQHQLQLTKAMPLARLYERSRSFRHLVRALSGLEYDHILIEGP